MRQPGEPVHSKFDFENNNKIQALQFIISAPKECDVKNLSFDIDNFKNTELAITLEAGCHLKYEGKNTATIYNKYWNIVDTIEINPKKFELAKGAHTLIFDCKFDGETEKGVKLELKTINDGEPIKL